jgi:hypothetical protein
MFDLFTSLLKVHEIVSILCKYGKYDDVVFTLLKSKQKKYF